MNEVIKILRFFDSYNRKISLTWIGHKICKEELFDKFEDKLFKIISFYMMKDRHQEIIP